MGREGERKRMEGKKIGDRKKRMGKESILVLLCLFYFVIMSMVR
jgi:hypothetical protein